MLQVFLDQDRPFKRASCEFALGVALGILGWGASLFFNANEHFRKEKAFELLPRESVFAHSNRAIKT